MFHLYFRRVKFNTLVVSKADDLRSLKRTGCMIGRWMYGVSLKDIWNVKVWMIGCLLAEGWWWRGRGVGAGVGRRENNV